MTDTTINLHAVERRGEALGSWLAQPLTYCMRALAHTLGLYPHADDPVTKAQREAADVRLLALRYRESDRGFAADLYAAADRHEEVVRSARTGSAADRR